MNPAACTYNPNATSDDGSCISFVYGCTESLALNFDPLANTDDSTCCGASLPIPFGTQIGQDIQSPAQFSQFGQIANEVFLSGDIFLL